MTVMTVMTFGIVLEWSDRAGQQVASDDDEKK